MTYQTDIPTMTKKKVDEVFFQLFCEKNSDGSKHLRLNGRELHQRFGYRLNAKHMPILVQFLKKYKEVVSLNLCYNNIGDEGMKILSEKYFNSENNLRYINLLHCDITSFGMKWLARSNFVKLKSLRLLGNKIGTEGARYIGQLIEKCKDLEDLDIGETDQTLESIESLLIMIEKSSLKCMNISRIIPHSYYSSYNDSSLADDLGVLLKLNDTLEEVHLQKCEFDGHDVELLLGGLIWHQKLQLLDLSSNRIGDHGMEFICQWLKTRPPLIALLLAANRISTAGCQALSYALPFSRIRVLDLQNNKIKDSGLADLISTIKKSTQIRMLYMWGNEIGATCLEKIEKMLNYGVLRQEYIDVKIYYVDDKRQGAQYPCDHFRNQFYSVYEYAYPPELKIKKNKLPEDDSLPRALVNVKYVDRFPPVDFGLLPRIIESKIDSPVNENNNKGN